MVRFADFIKDKQEVGPYGPTATEGTEGVNPRLRASEIHEALSESQISKVMGGQVSPASSSSFGWSEAVVTYYRRFLKNAIQIRDQVRKHETLNPSPVLSDLHDIITKNLVEKLYQYAMFRQPDAEELPIHTINVTFTALMVGEGMAYDVGMQLRLGLGAFLENVGMYRIPASVFRKKGKLDKNDMKMILDHPKESHKLLMEMGERYQWLAKIALQVHERSDGSGYPHGLNNGEIHELSSIIGLVDTYITMIGKRPYREKLVSTHAIKFIVEDAKNLFPQKIRKVFLNQITLFPINTYIRMNNNSIGRVLATDKKRAMRPVIEILYDGEGHKLEKRERIRLSENPLLYITGCVDEKELP